MHAPCHVPALLTRVQALSVGFRSFFTSPEGGNQLGFARAVRHTGLEPRTRRQGPSQALFCYSRV